MERLINNLLDMTRMEAGGMIVKKEWLPLQEVVGSALADLSGDWPGDRSKRIPPETPMVQMDGVLIEQVLTNLLDNVAGIHAAARAPSRSSQPTAMAR